MVRIRSWGMYEVYESPHMDRRVHVLGWGTMNRCILCIKERQERKEYRMEGE